METESPSPLLELPIELLTRITDFLDNESLLMVRLVCKAADAITFDRVGKEYFSHVYCWIAAAKSWGRLREIIHEFSRFKSKIRQITFTANRLEDKSIDDLNVVRQEEQTEVDARKNSMLAIWESHPRAPRNTLLLRRALFDVQRLRQDITIKLDFTGMDGHLNEELYEEILAAFAASRANVHELVTFGGALASQQEVASYSLLDLGASFQSLRSFTYAGYSWTGWNCVTGREKEFTLPYHILHSAYGLRRLEISMHNSPLNPGWSLADAGGITHIDSFRPQAVFTGCSLINLTSLDIRSTLIGKRQLLVIINVTMHTEIEASDEWDFDINQYWVDVVRYMRELYNLSHVELRLRGWAPQEEDERVHVKEPTMWEDVELDGRDNVEWGLQAIVDGAPYLFQPWET